jgi:hypothetical protein
MIENLAELRHQLLQKSPSQTTSNFYFASDDPRRMPHLSLEQQKKRAKELLKSLKAREAPARTRAYDAGIQNISSIEPCLAKSHHIIAVELGFD